MRWPCRYVSSTAAPTASAIKSAVPRKKRSASGIVKPRWRTRSIFAIGAASIRLAELVHVRRDAALIERQRDVDRRRLACDGLLVPRRSAIVPDDEIAASLRQIGELEFPVGSGPREIWRVEHEDVPDHRMMHVAIDAHVARVAERHGLLLPGAVETDVERVVF